METFSCKHKPTFKLILDGGVCGYFALLLCKKCYDEHPKQFLISHEKLQQSFKTEVIGIVAK